MFGKKSLAALSAIVLVAGVTACSSSDDTDAATSADATATNDATMSAPPATTPDAAAPAASGALPAGVTAEMVASGEQAFKGGVCIACHNADATGTPNAPNLTDNVWINTDGSYEGIKGIIKAGVPQPKEHPNAMPPMGGAQLTDDQINSIAAYIYSLSHKG